MELTTSSRKFGISSVFFVVYTVLFVFISMAFEDNNTIYSFFVDVAIGGIQGLCLGVLMGSSPNTILLSVQEKYLQKEIKINPNDTVIMDGAANYLNGLESIGGRVMLTTKYLIFKPSQLNFSKMELAVPVDQIREISQFQTLGHRKNGVRLISNSGIKINLILAESSKWLSFLKKEVK